MLRRCEIGRGGTAAAIAVHRHLIGARALLVGAVEVGVAAIADLLGAGDEAVVELVLRAQVRDRERPADAVVLIGPALLVLGLAEIAQHVVVGPAWIAALRPQGEILLLAA